MKSLKHTIIDKLKIINPEITFISFCEDSPYNIICNSKYGKIKLNIRYHVYKGNLHTLQCAIDKIEYWRKLMIATKGNQYDYSKAEYIKKDKKVILICKQHGEFKVTPNDYTNKNSGCPKCGNILKSSKKLYSNKEYIEAANKKHNYKYSYDKTIYKSGKEKIIVICPEHGEFTITATRHLHSSGCTQCGKLLNRGGYCIKSARKNILEYKSIKVSVYIVEVYNNNEKFYKIGITKIPIRRRFDGIPYEYKEIQIIKTNLLNAIFIENSLLNKLKLYRYRPKIEFGGHTECFNNINKIKNTIKKYEK